MPSAKPTQVFDRDAEWVSLAGFLDGKQATPLGIVYGRRRQGKTWLLEALAASHAGLLFTAACEEAEGAAARRLGADLGRHLGLPPFAFADLDAAIVGIVDLLRRGDLRLCILDEFSYLLSRRPDLPSVLQRHLDRAQHKSSASRLLLCGSAFTIMRNLIAGDAPLRGRASLALRVHPFDFRTAAAFWGLTDTLESALLVHSVLGGTPGYRDLAAAPPRRRADFDAWLATELLNPAAALFSEGILLLAEEDQISDRAIYQELLSTIVGGTARTNAIATELQRSSASLAPLLGLLESLDLVERVLDPTRSNRWFWHIAEPVLRFHHAILQPVGLRRRFERGDRTAWPEARERFHRLVLGPHFEQMCRQWTERHATSATLGGSVARVGRTEVADPTTRETIDVDVAAVDDQNRLLAIGEAKATGRPVGKDVIAPLERARELLVARGTADAATKLLLFSAAGFAPSLRRAAAAREDVELIDLERLYGGG